MVRFFTPPLEPLSLLEEEQAAETSRVEVSRVAIAALRRRRMVVRTCIPLEGVWRAATAAIAGEVRRCG
jgi:hypothetical protein